MPLIIEHCHSQRFIICHGTQQSLNLTHALFTNDSPIAHNSQYFDTNDSAKEGIHRSANVTLAHRKKQTFKTEKRTADH